MSRGAGVGHSVNFTVGLTLAVMAAIWSSEVGRAQATEALVDDLAIAIEMPERVAFGSPFEVRVVRAWPRSHVAQPFDTLGLLPLAIEELAADVAVLGQCFVETHRYRATAWEVGELEFGPLVMRARAAEGAVEQRVESPSYTLVVESVLPDPAGDIEWPGDVRDRQHASVWPLVVPIVVLVLGCGFALLRRRGRVVEPVDTGPTPREIAERELGALTLPADPPEIEPYYIALAEIVRRHASREFGVDAIVHTSQELVAVVPRDGDPLRDCLFACDLVKFAVDRPEQNAHELARQRAYAFVRGASAEDPR